MKYTVEIVEILKFRGQRLNGTVIQTERVGRSEVSGNLAEALSATTVLTHAMDPFMEGKHTHPILVKIFPLELKT